jgi:hypothetical protein
VKARVIGLRWSVTKYGLNAKNVAVKSKVCICFNAEVYALNFETFPTFRTVPNKGSHYD